MVYIISKYFEILAEAMLLKLEGLMSITNLLTIFVYILTDQIEIRINWQCLVTVEFVLNTPPY